ncbi:MAG: TonB C-terminal domain-containing protein, partial [Desulfocapsa sp.]|nr:TonB C-terminal domain-containing protein [Desulfocapsa sp.]
FNLAVLTHVFILASAIILPKYINKKPIPLEFLTVDLVNIAAPLPPSTPKIAPQPPPTQVKPKVTIQKPKPVEAKKTAPIKPIAPVEPIVVSEPAEVPIKAISIKPLKRKIKKKLPANTNNQRQRIANQKRQQEILKRQQQQLLQDARRQQVLADAESAAANDAVAALRQMLQSETAATAATAATSANQSSRPRQSGNASNLIEKQYQASIGGKLMQHWDLPEIKTWQSDLSARVIISIAKNGRIISHNFEKRSGDRVFDQFVSRTIQDSNPLLPIPGAMRVSQYSIGLVFKPGQIQ